MNPDGFLNTQQVADHLGITRTRVQQMIIAGRLPATKIGRDNFVREEDLALVEHRKRGRPRKSQNEGVSKAA